MSRTAQSGTNFFQGLDQRIANTIVQLIRSIASVLIAFGAQPNQAQVTRNRMGLAASHTRRKTMSIIDKALEANRNYAKTYNPTLGKRPAPKLVVVTCMDPRLSDLSGILGLPQADLDVIRTGGPAVTEDVLGELVVSNRVLGTTEILLLNHTGCGFTTFTDAELNAKLSASTGDASPAPMRFFSYKDPEQNTREQINKVRSHPWISKDVPVRGVIFDVETGLLREVRPTAQQAAA
jgi:carbonic anhydrase